MKIHNILLLSAFLITVSCKTHDTGRTEVIIKKDKFYINGEITLKGKKFEGYSIEGLLPNSRMVQGIFDDLNPETRHLWKYPDTGEWDADRNTNEFVESMSDWYQHGLLAFTLNLQGGSPTGYGNRGWYNSAFHENGEIRDDYFARLKRILDKADEIGQVVILGIFYFGQDQYLKDETAVINALKNTLDWLFEYGYKNVLIEVNNECNAPPYDHEILKPGRVHELIDLVKNTERNGYRYYVSTSFGGGAIPTATVVQKSDFILLHGNDVDDPARITEMVEITRQLEGYTPKPIIFNEDDHYDFDKPDNNMIRAFKSYASWGYFDFRKRHQTLEDDVNMFHEGFQSVPVDWGISSERKKEFFNLLAKITGNN